MAIRIPFVLRLSLYDIRWIRVLLTKKRVGIKNHRYDAPGRIKIDDEIEKKIGTEGAGSRARRPALCRPDHSLSRRAEDP